MNCGGGALQYLKFKLLQFVLNQCKFIISTHYIQTGNSTPGLNLVDRIITSYKLVHNSGPVMKLFRTIMKLYFRSQLRMSTVTSQSL